jgi:hypothetical protein
MATSAVRPRCPVFGAGLDAIVDGQSACTGPKSLPPSTSESGVVGAESRSPVAAYHYHRSASATAGYASIPVAVPGAGWPALIHSSITCQTSLSNWFSFQMPYAVPSSTGGTATSPIAPLTAASTHS